MEENLMVKVIICVRRNKGKDEEINLETDFQFNVGDVITFPDRIRKTNSYHAIEITDIKRELHERFWKKELVVIIGAEEHY
jgi:hypothetical protein